MEVKATRAFQDLEAGKRREPGETFAVSAKRGEQLVGLGLASAVEKAEKPKPARRRSAKPKE